MTSKLLISCYLLLVCISFVVLVIHNKKTGKKPIAEILFLIVSIIIAHPIQKGLDYLLAQTSAGETQQETNSTFSIEGNYHEHSILVNIGQMSMIVGEEYQVPFSLDEPEAYSHQLLWKSSNDNCVVVSEEGKLTAADIGVSKITVCYKDAEQNRIRSNAREFLVFVLNNKRESDQQLSASFSGISERENNTDEYIIFFDINNPFRQEVHEAQIVVCTEDGNISVKNTDLSGTTSNFAGTFKLDYYGNYVVYAKLIATDGSEYVSQAQIIRPNEHVSR